MPDLYRSFTELSASEQAGIDYRITSIDRGTDYAVLAPHGGNIEPGTSEIARALAGDQLSYYVFEGLKPEANSNLHITSTRFDEPTCIGMVESCHTAIALHGESSDRDMLFLGGRDSDTLQRITDALTPLGFAVGYHQNPLLQGTSERNICNRGRSGAGVQLELGRGLRRQLFGSLDEEGRKTTTDRFRHLINGLRQAIS